MKERELLTIPKHVKFGIEIEMEKTNYNNVCKLFEAYNSKVDVHEDMSLSDDSAEVSTTVLNNTKNDIYFLKFLSNMLKTIDVSFKDCSFQVNLDSDFSDSELIIFLKLYAYYEDIILRFSKGVDKSIRDSALIYSNLILNELIFYTKKEYEIIDKLIDNKNFSLSLKKNRIIEFRIPNSTFELELWKNYITVFYYLIETVKHKRYDFEKIEYYIIDKYNNSNIGYSLLDKEIVVDESKLNSFLSNVFLYDIDREYFLDQYNQEFKILKK